MPAETRALTLITSLTSGVSFDIPEIDFSGPLYEIPGDINSDLYASINRLTADNVTNGDPDGTGVFDQFMRGLKAHLRQEYDAGRITGAEYTKTYIAMTELAMGNAVQFLLERENSFWASQRSQIDAIIARAELGKQKILATMAGIDANTAKANYARAVLSLATADVEYETAEFNLTDLLPKQSLKLTAENLLLATQNDKLLADTLLTEGQTLKTEQETTQIIAQTQLTCAQKLNVEAQTLNEPKKGALLDEQMEATRAQTADFRTDNSAITGSIGKQKDLYTQQITAYQRDSEVKVAKIFSDAWITQKTIDEGLTAPTGFTNASLDEVLATLKVNNGLTGFSSTGS